MFLFWALLDASREPRLVYGNDRSFYSVYTRFIFFLSAWDVQCTTEKYISRVDFDSSMSN